jgi:hypothetical protein
MRNRDKPEKERELSFSHLHFSCSRSSRFLRVNFPAIRKKYSNLHFGRPQRVVNLKLFACKAKIESYFL